MKFYKIFLTLAILFLSFNHIVFADDENEEFLSYLPPVVETSININNTPIINSRAAIVYDRSTGSILFGKNENEKRKMASTTNIMTS